MISVFLFMLKRPELLCSLVMKGEQDAGMGNHLGVYREGMTIMDTKSSIVILFASLCVLCLFICGTS
jgi:hypothetical protein